MARLPVEPVKSKAKKDKKDKKIRPVPPNHDALNDPVNFVNLKRGIANERLRAAKDRADRKNVDKPNKGNKPQPGLGDASKNGVKAAKDWRKAARKKHRGDNDKRIVAPSAGRTGPDTSKKAGKKGGKGRNGGHGHGSRGPGSTSDGVQSGSTTTASDYRSRADAAVDLMLNPKINALLGQQDEISSEYTNQKNDLNEQTARQLSDLSTTYAQLQNTLGTLNQQALAGYDDAAATQKKSFEELVAALQGNSQGQASGVADEFKRLGITGDVTQLQSDAQFAEGQANTAKANAAANLAAQKANQNAFGTNSLGNYAAMGVQDQTQTKQAASDMLNDLLYQRNTDFRKIGSQLTDTRGQRGALEHQLMEQYEQQAYERMMEQQQQSFMNQMGVNNFNLEQDQFNADQAYRQAQLALEGQGLELRAQDQQAKQQQQQQKAVKLPEGYQGAVSWINQNVKSPRRRGDISAIMQRVNTHTRRGEEGGLHDFDQTDPKDFNSILKFMYKILDREKSLNYMDGPNGKQALQQALSAYFGRLPGQ